MNTQCFLTYIFFRTQDWLGHRLSATLGLQVLCAGVAAVLMGATPINSVDKVKLFSRLYHRSFYLKYSISLFIKEQI